MRVDLQVAQMQQPPENFRELSVVPTKEDLLGNMPFLRPNIVQGGYNDVEHYLDVQFRLLREDCFGPFRDGLSEYGLINIIKHHQMPCILSRPTKTAHFIYPVATKMHYYYAWQNLTHPLCECIQSLMF